MLVKVIGVSLDNTLSEVEVAALCCLSKYRCVSLNDRIHFQISLMLLGY